MANTLTSNVHVDGKWYGPDYPQNGEPPSGSVTNPAAFADPAADNVDLRFRADDFGVESGEQPNLRQGETGPAGATLSSGDEPPRGGAGSGKDAWAAFAAQNGVEVPDDATRDDIIAALEERGVIEPE